MMCINIRKASVYNSTEETSFELTTFSTVESLPPMRLIESFARLFLSLKSNEFPVNFTWMDRLIKWQYLPCDVRDGSCVEVWTE